MSRYSKADANILFSPWVLRAAWRKVRNWGESAVWLDTSELLAWEADPWAQLARLATDLREDRWHPYPFPLVPYPKKGDQTRHFCQPSMRDQVGFAVFMVLLGPFLEARMPNVSFGNRLFRPRVLRQPAGGSSRKDEEDDGARWFRAPFSLGQDRVYESFSSGYGLFRRLLQWVTNDGLLGAAPRRGDDERDREDPDLLPYFQGRFGSPWSSPPDRDRPLHYLRIDLSTTYPAISREALGRTMKVMLGDEATLSGRLPADHGRWGLPIIGRSGGEPGIWHPDGGPSPFPGWLEKPRNGLDQHPWRLLAGDAELRLILADQLCAALDQVEYAPWAEPAGWATSDDTGEAPARVRGEDTIYDEVKYDTAGIWRPSCSLPADLRASQRFGLPTGLIVGGLLCNAALTPLDWHFCRRFEEARRDNTPRLLFLRFVDDIVLLSERPEALFEAVHQIKGLLGDHPYLMINAEKTRPDGYENLVRRVVEGGPLPTGRELNQLPRLTRASADLFTTEMVREMSELGEEALDERYGGPGLERTERLLSLLGRGDSDEEVADAARLSFALGRLAQASWPDGPITRGDRPPLRRKQLEQLILHSAERAVRAHPARTQLWRPTLILALRTGQAGLAVLTEQVLPLIAWSSPRAGDDANAWNTWEGTRPAEPDLVRPTPDDSEDAETVEHRRVQNRRLRASWHRAAFWRNWLSVLLELRRRVEAPASRRPRSGTWLSHLDRAEARAALTTMENLEHWLAALYPDVVEPSYWGESGAFLWWWEAEALRSALLALTPPSVEALRWLGAPAAGSLRELQGTPPGLPNSLAKHGDLLAALNRTLGAVMVSTDDGLASGLGSPISTDIWLARLKRPDAPTSDIATPSDVGSMAQLARVLPPERLLSWLKHVDGPLPRPTVVPEQPDDWRRVETLDTYRQLRGAMLSLGLQPTWQQFEGWFAVEDIGTWPGASEGENGLDLRSTLLALPRDLLGDDGGSPALDHPALCPALGVSPAISIWVAHALRPIISPSADGEAQATTENMASDDDWQKSLLSHIALRGLTGAFLSPETVRLSTNANRLLRSQRVWSVARDPREEKRAWDLLPPGDHGADSTKDEYGARLAEKIMDELRRGSGGDTPAWITHVAPLRSQDPAPHPMFLFARCFIDHFKKGNPDRWALSTLVLWLLTGGEHELDRLFEVAPWQPAAFDRQVLRSRLLLPRNTWAWIEEGFGGQEPFLGLIDGPLGKVSPELDLPDGRSVFDVRLALDRHDILFDADGAWQVSSLTRMSAPPAPGSSSGGSSSQEPNDDLRVRLIQPVADPELRRWLDSEGSPPVPLVEDAFVYRKPLRELCEQLQEIRLRSKLREPSEEPEEIADKQGQRDKRRIDRGLDDLALFPEWYVPHFEASALIQFVNETGVAIIAGLSPRELPRMVHAAASLRTQGLRVLINEALVVIPTRAASPDRRGRGAHAFWIRKPYPNAQEQGLALHLSEAAEAKAAKAHWRFQRGLTWTRFRLPTWGGFTVAICSDILDTFAWDWLRGRIQHLFIVAYNTDLDLFDKMTWTRAYELFANVAMSNHGSQGGTLSWTPKHGHHKQLFEVKGPRKGIAVTVELPVKKLMIAQRDGGSDAAKDSQTKFWDKIANGEKPDSDPKRGFKSPAPGYRRKDD